VRGRFLFCAALAAAAYIKGRLDAAASSEGWLPPALDPVNDVTRAMAEQAATAAPVADEVPDAPDSRGDGETGGTDPVWTEAEATDPEAVWAGAVVEEVHPGWAAGVYVPETAEEAEVCGAPDVEGVILDPVTPAEEAVAAHTVAADPVPAAAEQVTTEFPAIDPAAWGDVDAPTLETTDPTWGEDVPAAPVAEAVVPPADEPAPAAPPIVAVGPFAISGVAVHPGDLAFGRVLFPSRLPVAPAADDVALTLEHAENVPEGGVSVMADGGFGPSREGLTLVVAVADAGRFVVRGHYTVRRPG
jgi:hypothetical protein